MKRNLLLSLMLLLLIGTATKAFEPNPKNPIEYRVHEQDSHKDIEVKTELADYIFSTAGGVLKSIYLHFAPYGSQKAELIADVERNSETGERTYVQGAMFPFTTTFGEEVEEGTYDHLIQKGQNELVLIMTGQAGDLRVTKSYTIYNDASYRVDLSLVLENSSEDKITLEKGFRMTMGVNQFGSQADVKGKARYIIDGQKRESIPSSYGSLDGLGFVSKEFVKFLQNRTPLNQVYPFVEFDERGRERLGIRSEELTLTPGQQREYSFTLYGGRNRYIPLEEAGMKEIVDVSFYNRILVSVIRLLNWLYKATGNYGWAIILFTLITRIILFPLMRKQYYSMAKMQKLQPKMEKLRERYKKEKEILNKKMMELYQKEGINPLSGCLPLLIQFPILIILWRAILYSAEQIHLSPGFLWMSDLSLRDPYYIIVALNVIAMILQYKLLTPAGGGRQNPMLTYGMPIFMGFFLRDFPAGLWLYWLLTTLFQAAQQWFINWEMGRAEPVEASDPK